MREFISSLGLGTHVKERTSSLIVLVGSLFLDCLSLCFTIFQERDGGNSSKIGFFRLEDKGK